MLLGTRRRLGFGMLEIVVLLAIASVIGVLTAVMLAQSDRLARVQQTWTALERTRLAILVFNADVGVSPQLVSHLVVQIVNGDKNSCGNNYNGGQRGSWLGPYGGFTIDATVGVPTAIGIGNNTMVRNPTGGGNGTLAIVMPNVDVEDASLLDKVFDNADGSAAGVIQWTAPVGGLVTMSYMQAVTAC